MKNSYSEITPYADLNDVLLELAKGIKSILTDNLYGIYLQGSFAIGDFDEHSDVDFIIVFTNKISGSQLYDLQALHKQIYKLKSGWAQHLEGTYFDLNSISNPPKKQDRFWYLDNGSQELIKSDHCNTFVVRWVLREKGKIIYGPSPNTYIKPIKLKTLRKDIYYEIYNWGNEIIKEPQRFNNRFYQTFIVLNYCRMYHDLIHGTINSKRVGAEWAKKILNQKWQDLIDRAWLGRPTPEFSVKEKANESDFYRTIEFIKLIIEKSNKWMKRN